MMALLSPVLGIGQALIERLWPDPTERAKAQLELTRMANEGELKDVEARLQAIIAEASSADPWTSRARPSYLYVVYLVILWAIPMGVLAAVAPQTAETVQRSMQQWWAAIPEEFWTSFMVGYSGYTLARSFWDKRPAGK